MLVHPGRKYILLRRIIHLNECINAILYNSSILLVIRLHDYYVFQITITHAQYCSWSARTVSFVNVCPSDEESTQRQIQVKQCVALSLRQNCTMPAKFKYHCLSSNIPGKLVEVCTTETEISGEYAKFPNYYLAADQ